MKVSSDDELRQQIVGAVLDAVSGSKNQIVAMEPVLKSHMISRAVTVFESVAVEMRGRQHQQIHSQSVEQVIRQRIGAVDEGLVDEDAFLVADCGEIVRQHQRWTRMLPRIQPYYAVKCNTDAVVLDTMHKLQVGYDCASKAEIAQVLAMGVTAD